MLNIVRLDDKRTVVIMVFDPIEKGGKPLLELHIGDEAFKLGEWVYHSSLVQMGIILKWLKQMDVPYPKRLEVLQRIIDLQPNPFV